MTTRPEFGVPDPCYSGAAFYRRTADAVIALELAGAQKAPRWQMLVSHTPVPQGQRSITELLTLGSG